jgi:hypothetical protein
MVGSVIKRVVYLIILSVVQKTQLRTLGANTSPTEGAYRGLKWGTYNPGSDL